MAGPLRLRPLAPEDEAELLRIHATPEVARWWDAPDEGFPFSDDPGATRLVIEVDGAVAGMIQYAEELEPKYRHASIDLFLDPALHGRGIGTEAVRRVVRMLIDERGHHRITIDPAAANAVVAALVDRRPHLRRTASVPIPRPCRAGSRKRSIRGMPFAPSSSTYWVVPATAPGSSLDDEPRRPGVQSERKPLMGRLPAAGQPRGVSP